MEVSGIGAGVAATGGGGISSVGTANATAPSAATADAPRIDTQAAPSIPANMQQLMDTLRDFSSAEILMALIMMKALAGDDDEKKGSGGAGLALLAGMALASQLGQSCQCDFAAGIAPIGDVGGATAGAGFTATA